MSEGNQPSAADADAKPALDNLIKLLQSRRSRRFGLGMEIPGGPLAFKSRFPPSPLDKRHEALLAYAAAGITGNSVRDLDFSAEGGGNIIAGSIGRTIASGDAINSVALAIINDSGTFMVPRPVDCTPQKLAEMASASTEVEISKIYSSSLIQIGESRPMPPKQPIFNLKINQWSANGPGSTLFLPINDLGHLYINGLLEIFNEFTGAFIVDERRHMRPAGLAKFGSSRGGHLNDDPNQGKVATIRNVENMVAEFVSIEQGEMLQNLALMAETLGIGGFPHFANHEFAWFEALGFEMKRMSASRYLGAGSIVGLLAKLMSRNPSIPFPIALKHGDQELLQGLCPPNFSTMRAAVEHVVNEKRKRFEQQLPMSASWKRPGDVERNVAGISETAVEATVAYCEYVYEQYGRFPAYHAPFRTVMAFQAAYLDEEFYDRFYEKAALPEVHRLSSKGKRDS